MKYRLLVGAVVLGSLAFVGGCGDDDGTGAAVVECMPEGACMCGPGNERPIACSCAGGSSCVLDGNEIEFQCQGNAGCGMSCGTDCLVTCPGTTQCTVEVGDRGIVSCPGTATCDIVCHGDCTVQMAGAARSTIRCEHEADGAECVIEGCQPTDCGDGVWACGTACPAS